MDGSTFLTSTNNDVIPILCGERRVVIYRGTRLLTTSYVCGTLGTFTSVYLYILSFSTLTRKLSIHKRIEGQGPHQYLALSPGRDTLYATSWAWPPSLYAFGLGQDQKDGRSDEQSWSLTLDYKGKTSISECRSTCSPE